MKYFYVYIQNILREKYDHMCSTTLGYSLMFVKAGYFPRLAYPAVYKDIHHLKHHFSNKALNRLQIWNTKFKGKQKNCCRSATPVPSMTVSPGRFGTDISINNLQTLT